MTEKQANALINELQLINTQIRLQTELLTRILSVLKQQTAALNQLSSTLSRS